MAVPGVDLDHHGAAGQYERVGIIGERLKHALHRRRPSDLHPYTASGQEFAGHGPTAPQSDSVYRC